MQKQIKYKGITRLPSDHDSFDGEMEEMYNLVNKNGELRPVVPPETIGGVQGEFVFVHKTGEFEHFISYQDGLVIAYKYLNSITFIQNVTDLNGSTLIKVEAIGNTLVILTDKDVKYALWKDGVYIDIGSNIPFPNIRFKMSGSIQSYIQRERLDGSLLGELNKIRSTAGYYPVNSKNTPGESIVNVEVDNAIKAHINKEIQSREAGGKNNDKSFIFPFFIRYAIRMYDGSLIKHSHPCLMLPSKFEAFEAMLYPNSGDNGTVVTYKYPAVRELLYENDIIDLSHYKDLVEGIDIFISAPIYSYIYAGKINGSVDVWGNVVLEYKKIMGLTKSKEEIYKEISEVGTFYKAASLSLDDLKTSSSGVKLKLEDVSALENKEVMKDDYYSHENISATNSFSYNSKIHLSGIRRELFSGFRIGHKTYYDNHLGAAIDVGVQPFMFYPGKATSVTIVEKVQVDQWAVRKIDLKPHKYLNGSYYLDSNLENISPGGNNIIRGQLEPPFHSRALVTKDEPNKLYVSTLQNPFLFPVESRITLPVGKIHAVSSNTRAISSGQFGQFPLYAFTDDGVWVLEINQEGAYIARQAVSREVAINTNIMQMDSHVAFITVKGVTILSGADTECISDIISDNNTRRSTLNIEPFFSAVEKQDTEKVLLSVYNSTDSELFFKGCQMAYEYLNERGRIVAINPNYSYAYIFDIASKTWGKIKSDYKRVVNNYPDSYVQDANGNIINLSTLSSSNAKIKTMYITRPITMDDTLFNIDSLVHRVIGNEPIVSVLYGSRDGINYSPVKYCANMFMRMIGTPYRYFKLAVVSYMRPRDVVSGAQIITTPRYTNRLR